MASAPSLKTALEDLLRNKKLEAERPPLRGEDTRPRPVTTGIGALDNAILGFPRGQLSEITGPLSSGRTGVLHTLLARATRHGSLAAWIDPHDRFDPESAAAAGALLDRLLWLRGRSLNDAAAAAATLLGSGLFEAVVLDAASASRVEFGRLPGSTWIRLQRAAQGTPTALLLAATQHIACGPLGVRLDLQRARPRWSGAGPGRLLRGLDGEAAAGRHALQRVAFTLHAL